MNSGTRAYLLFRRGYGESGPAIMDVEVVGPPEVYSAFLDQRSVVPVGGGTPRDVTCSSLYLDYQEARAEAAKECKREAAKWRSMAREFA